MTIRFCRGASFGTAHWHPASVMEGKVSVSFAIMMSLYFDGTVTIEGLRIIRLVTVFMGGRDNGPAMTMFK